MIKHTKSYIKNHPNPQFTRTNFISLDGQWNFCFDDEKQGINKKYHLGLKNPINILVPYTYETEKSGINDHQVHTQVWYEKRININKSDKRYLLHFEGVDYYCEVYLNGNLIGNHQGGYSRFSFDITDNLTDGDNLLVLKVNDDLSCTHARGKQRWMHHSYECFYVQTTGIWKSVWIEEVGNSYLKSALMNPSYKNTNVEIEYQIENFTDNLELETIISFNDEIIAKERKLITRNIFSQTIDITSDSATMKSHCWSPNCPNLYDVEFNLYHNNQLIDEVKSYFGIAEFASSNNCIYLNRNQIFPKLVLDQGYWKDSGLTLSEEQIIKDIELMKDIGLNGCRKHEKIECDLFYYYADILGYYLWQELPSAYEFRVDTINNLTKEWIDILLQHHNHPCIMTDVIINESWGTMAISNHSEQQNFVNGLYYLTKSIEKNRFLISNDGWEHTKSDLLTTHNYATTYDELMDEYTISSEEFNTNYRNIHVGTKQINAGNYQNLNVPLLLSEFSGIAFAKDKNKGWGYGELALSNDEFINKLKGQVDSIFDCHLFSGYCITQLSDVQQEVNGLVNEDREYKVSKESLKEIFSRNF